MCEEGHCWETEGDEDSRYKLEENGGSFAYEVQRKNMEYTGIHGPFHRSKPFGACGFDWQIDFGFGQTLSRSWIPWTSRTSASKPLDRWWEWFIILPQFVCLNYTFVFDYLVVILIASSIVYSIHERLKASKEMNFCCLCCMASLYTIAWIISLPLSLALFLLACALLLVALFLSCVGLLVLLLLWPWCHCVAFFLCGPLPNPTLYAELKMQNSGEATVLLTAEVIHPSPSENTQSKSRLTVGHGESTGRLSFATVDAVFYKRYNLFLVDDLTIRVTVDIEDKAMQTASSLQEP